MKNKKKHVAILGSTGSIGKQALEVISEHEELFIVEVLTCNRNVSLLIEQAKKFNPNAVVVTHEENLSIVRDSLLNLGIKVFGGEQSLEEIVEMESIDIVLTALVGYSGLKPTIK